MSYEIRETNAYKKSLEILKARHWDLSSLDKVITKLKNGEHLERNNKDHFLKGYVNPRVRECHIKNDWILIYAIINDENRLWLINTGPHTILTKTKKVLNQGLTGRK